MYLLNTASLTLSEFVGKEIPHYAILSHTWGKEEISFEALSNGHCQHLKGYAKIQACSSLAASEGFEWVWIDTCCIDKKSSAELSEAINSMYSWYENAIVCYAYLEDLSLKGSNASILRGESISGSRQTFRMSRWFSRGWTLQELLAPRSVVFYDKDWIEIGTKKSLQAEISAATNINPLCLNNHDAASTAQKLSWAAHRQTTREEDMAYCLLGLLNVNMPLLYGEGKNAFRRLQEEVIKTSSDHSIFAWTNKDLYISGLLAQSPADFVHCGNIQKFHAEPFNMTNRGLSINLNYIFTSVLNHRDLELIQPCEFTGREIQFGNRDTVGAVLGCQDGNGRCVIWLKVDYGFSGSEEGRVECSRILPGKRGSLPSGHLKDLLRNRQFTIKHHFMEFRIKRDQYFVRLLPGRLTLKMGTLESYEFSLSNGNPIISRSDDAIELLSKDPRTDGPTVIRLECPSLSCEIRLYDYYEFLDLCILERWRGTLKVVWSHRMSCEDGRFEINLRY